MSSRLAIRKRASRRWAAFALAGIFVLAARRAPAQAVDITADPAAPPPPLTYRGLVPGIDTMEKVKEILGPPFQETKFYAHKLYYPSTRGKEFPDVFQMSGGQPGSRIGDIEACSVPEGYETEAKIREKLGEPEAELRMATWKALDYAAKGVRFSLSPEGKTTGVAYFSHGMARVHPGARRLMDLTHLRQGPQAKPANPALPEGLKCGASEVVFSPTDPTWLKSPFKVHDDLKARIAVFSDGKLSIALVGADLFGMGWQDFHPIREAARKLGIEFTIVGMSHNHAAGDTIGVYGFYPKDYIGHIQNQLSEGIKQAFESMKPVKEIRSASKELPMEGTRVVGLFRNARNPGVLDPTVSLVQAIGEDGKPIASIMHFACHVEGIDYEPLEISADFPGYMCEKMKADGMGQAVFLNGALGGMVSGDNESRTHESASEMGLALAKIAGELAAIAQPPAEFHFSAEARRVEIPTTNPRLKMFGKKIAREQSSGRVVTDMQYVRLAEAQIVTLPGEVLPEVSFEILEKMKGFPRILVGLANDQLGYIIPPEDFREDSYEESMSQGPGAAPIVRDTALRMIEGVR